MSGVYHNQFLYNYVFTISAYNPDSARIIGAGPKFLHKYPKLNLVREEMDQVLDTTKENKLDYIMKKLGPVPLGTYEFMRKQALLYQQQFNIEFEVAQEAEREMLLGE